MDMKGCPYRIHEHPMPDWDVLDDVDSLHSERTQLSLTKLLQGCISSHVTIYPSQNLMTRDFECFPVTFYLEIAGADSNHGIAN